VHCFEHGAFFADVCARHKPEPANQTSAQIGNDITIKVLAQQHIELFGPHHKLHRRVVYNHIGRFNVSVFLRHGAEAFQEKSVRHLHDVRFVRAGDLFPLFAASIRESKSRDSRRGLLSDDLQTLDHAGNDFMFQTGVKAFRVFTHHYQIQIGIATGDIRQRADGPQVGIQIERLAQPDINGSEALSDGRRNRTFQADFVYLDRFEQLVRQSLAELVQSLLAGNVLFPFDRDAGSFDDANNGGRDFGADAIAGNQCDTMHKNQSTSYLVLSTLVSSNQKVKVPSTKHKALKNQMSGHSIGSTLTADVVIIGGGIIGLTIARNLAKRGARNVTVIEKHQFGREASWAAGGILAPQVEADRNDDFFRLACASRDLYPDFARALEGESGIAVGFDTTGTIYVAFSEAEETGFQARYAWQRAQGLAVEWLTGDEARRVEPCLANNVRCALRFPNDYQVENRLLVEALLIANERLGVRLITGCKALALKIDNSQVAGVETSKGFISTRTTVIAAGAWSSMVTALDAIHVEPVRGQMLCFKPKQQFARHVIYSARGYLIPRSDGRLLAGSTTEEAGFDKTVTDEGVNAIKSMAYEIAPTLESLDVVDSWAGFRPRSEDGLPILGPSKKVEGLFYATGHYRNGILLAPITGELIAEAIVSGTIPRLASPFSPHRFAS
jgi:glycine oxidase